MKIAKVEQVEIPVGLGFSITVTVRNKTTQQPIDISTWTIQAHVIEAIGQRTILASGVCTVTDGPNGVFEMTMTSAESEKLVDYFRAVISYAYLDSGIGMPLTLGYGPAKMKGLATWA